MIKRIKLTVAYDGTNFFGWAKQNELRTIQGTLENIISDLCKESIQVTGASRTDSGVHAKAQVCHFDTSRPVPPEKWMEVLNDRLDLDLAIIKSEQVSSIFESRFSAQYRHYQYRLSFGKIDPFQNRYCYHIKKQHSPDHKLMQKAANLLVGIHDFYYLCQKEPEKYNTVRKLFSVKITPVQNEIRIDIKGTAFIRGMMRRISGALLEVGLGRRSVEDFAKLIRPDLYHSLPFPVVLPARGLCLEKIVYGRHPKDIRSS